MRNTRFEPKPGQIRVWWGKIPHQAPGIVVHWGEECAKADAALCMGALTSRTHHPGFTGPGEWAPGLIEELERRGYDPATIEFTVQKKKPPTAKDLLDALAPEEPQ